MNDQPRWMRLPQGPERQAEWARWVLIQLNALRVSGSVQGGVQLTFERLGYLRTTGAPTTLFE